MTRRNVMLSKELIEALRANGLVPEDTRRVVIDLKVDDLPILHVEKYGDRALLKVTDALAGVEVQRLEAPGRQRHGGWQPSTTTPEPPSPPPGPSGVSPSADGSR